MYKKEGYWDVKPKIKRLSFPKRGKFQVDLQDILSKFWATTRIFPTKMHKLFFSL